MKWAMVVLIGMSFAFWGCGDDAGGDSQAELADLLVQDVEFGVDTDCLRDKTGQLSEEDAQFLIDKIDAEDTEGFASDLQEWVTGLTECVSEELLLDE